MATMDRFRFGMRDALANGLPLTDALGQGISAAAAADEAGRKKGFQRSITDAIGRGLTARQAIGDALGAGYNTADYGVKGMRKGVRKAEPASGSGSKPAGAGGVKYPRNLQPSYRQAHEQLSKAGFQYSRRDPFGIGEHDWYSWQHPNGNVAVVGAKGSGHTGFVIHPRRGKMEASSNTPHGLAAKLVQLHTRNPGNS